MKPYGRGVPPELTDLRSVWADAIRVERVRRRLRQADVAEMANLDQATVSNAEFGRALVQTYEAIARALGLDLVSGAS